MGLSKRLKEFLAVALADARIAEELSSTVDEHSSAIQELQESPGGGGSTFTTFTFTSADVNALGAGEVHPGDPTTRLIGRISIPTAVPAGKQLLSIRMKLESYFPLKPAFDVSGAGYITKIVVPGTVPSLGSGSITGAMSFAAATADIAFFPPPNFAYLYATLNADNASGDQAGLPYNQIQGSKNNYYATMNYTSSPIPLELYFEIIDFINPLGDWSTAIETSGGVLKVTFEYRDIPE